MAKKTGVKEKVIGGAVEAEFGVSPAVRMWELGVPEKAQMDVLAHAKVRFLEGAKFPDIHYELAIPLKVYMKYEAKWIKERDEVDVKIVEGVRKERIGQDAKEFVNLGFNIMLRTLKYYDKQEVILEPKDLKLVSDAVFGVNKIRRLENDQPTDITKFDNKSPKELMQDCVKYMKENEDYLKFIPIDVTPKDANSEIQPQKEAD